MSDEFPEELTKLYSYVKQLDRLVTKNRHMTIFGRSILSVAGFVLFFVLLIPVIASAIFLVNRSHTQYVFLTGPAGSTTAYIAPRIHAILNAPELVEQLLHLNIVPNFELRSSCGGLDTNAQINAGVAHLGFAEDGFFGDSTSPMHCSSASEQTQANIKNIGAGTKMRVLMSLYKSPLHVVVRTKLGLSDPKRYPPVQKSISVEMGARPILLAN